MKFKLRFIFFSFLIGFVCSSFLFLFLIKDNKKEEHIIKSNVILREIKNLKKLELTQFIFNDLLEYSIDRKVFGWDFLAPDSKSLILVYGEAIAGVNLEKIDSTSVEILNDKIVLRLPAPEIFSIRIDHSKTKIISVNLTAKILNPDISQRAFAKSEEFIKNAAIANNIIETTKNNAKNFFVSFIKLLTNKNCEVIFKEEISLQLKYEQ